MLYTVSHKRDDLNKAIAAHNLTDVQRLADVEADKCKGTKLSNSQTTNGLLRGVLLSGTDSLQHGCKERALGHGSGSFGAQVDNIKTNAMLYTASIGDHLSIPNFLEFNLDVNTHWQGTTALICAAKLGHVRYVAVLLDNGPNVNVDSGDYDFGTALKAAISDYEDTFD
jgi:ankyrin repeat protein